MPSLLFASFPVRVSLTRLAAVCLVAVLVSVRVPAQTVTTTASPTAASPTAAETATDTTADIATAKPEDVGMSSQKLGLVMPVLKNFVDTAKVPHAIVAVARRGKIVLMDSVGWSDIDGHKEISNDAILRFYSMTKPITSVAIMMLVEDGKIDLDADVVKYVPEFAGLKVYRDDGLDELVRPMTVRDLLRHTSGLTYGFSGNTAVDRQYRDAGVLSPSDTLQTTIEKLGKLPLMYQPGTRFNYSVSTDVLGHIVERVAGCPLDDFFQTQISEPLDMNDTSFQVPKSKSSRFVNNYSPTAGGLRATDGPPDSAFLKSPQAFSGGGGMVSTARDYVRFCQMLLNGGELNGTRLLESGTVEQMTQNQLPKEAYPVTLGGTREGVGFGLGFSVVVETTEYTKDCHLGEYGWGGAASTHFWISPKDDLLVVVLTQHMPYSSQLEDAVKPLVYDALLNDVSRN